jgi:NADPH2:quinone reductase
MRIEGRRVIVAEFAESPEEVLDGKAKTTLEPFAIDTEKLAPRDVVVAVKSATVGWVDLLMTSGQYQHMPKPPYTPGLECAGEVIWRGPDAKHELGARVIVDGFLAGPRSLGTYQSYGGFASHVVAPSEAVVAIPGKLSFDQASALLGSYETAYHCVVARGRLQAGETILIHGASGATGLAAVQVAKILGATVIATGRSDDKLAEVKAHGADHVVNVKGGMREQVKALTNGQGVDVVYDAVGGDISLESLRCVKFGARFLVVGWASTPFVAKGKGQRGAPNANMLPTNLIMMKGLDVLGCPTAISTAVDPGIRAPRLKQVLAWAEEGRIAPHVSHTFPLADYLAAMRARWSGEVIGGCVLHPA